MIGAAFFHRIISLASPRIAQRGVLSSHAAVLGIFLKSLGMIYFQEESVTIK